MATNHLPKNQLTPGCKTVLRIVAKFRFITIPQLQALLGGFSYTRTKIILFELWKHGFLERLILTKAARRIKFSYVFALSRSGARRLVLDSGLNRIFYIKSGDKRSTIFLEHTLLINDFRICLLLLARSTKAVQMESWKQTKQEVKVNLN